MDNTENLNGKNNIYIELPQDVRDILSQLRDSGNEAFAVGGCVRDSILGRVPEDWDITTSALPVEVKTIFKRTVDTGIKHGTITVMIGKKGYEVTTYRVDGAYEDGRHPTSVAFSSSLIEDLKRRDFTINAMAYNEEQGLVDEFDGIGDLERGIIRCVGDAKERFTEDALRMMRAVRFSAQLGFDIEEETFRAVSALAPSIAKVSMERIHVELNKTLLSDHSDYFVFMHQTGLTREILPVIDNILTGKRSRSILQVIKYCEKDLILKYAALFSHSTKGEAEETLRILKLDNYTILNVSRLVSCVNDSIDETEPAVREAIHRYGREFMPMLMKLQTAVLSAREEVTGIMMKSAKNHLAAIKRLYDEITERGDCISIKDLDIGGDDLMEYGLRGPRIGETLNELLGIVMENPKLNDKATLIALIENR